MKQRNRYNYIKTIAIFASMTLLINTPHVAYSEVSETIRGSLQTVAGSLRGKLPSIISKARGQVKSSLATAYNKVKAIKTEEVIRLLRNNVEKLGTQVGDIKDCMLFGDQCSATKRAAFYATAITVLALTAVAVGFTITVAATSKEPDKELSVAMDNTSQKVKGWKPEAIFQRLNNQLASFKTNLLSMERCLIKQRCTKTQKRMLYATAATIVALVTIALGVGVGAYIYAEHKKKQRIEELPGELLVEEVPEGTTLKFDDEPLKERALTQFQRFFRSKIDVTQAGAQSLKAAYQEIKTKVQERAIRTIGDLKNKTDEFIETAIKKANGFAGLLQETLQVNINNLKSGMATAKTELDTLKQNIQEAKNLNFPITNLTNYVKYITDNVALIAPEGTSKTAALDKIATIKGQDLSYLQDKLRVRTEEWKKGSLTKDRVTQVENAIKIKQFIKLDNLQSIYPTLVSNINQLRIYQVGNVVNGVLSGIAALLGAAATINKQAGKIGLILSTNRMQEGLQELKYGIEGLGRNIKTTLNNKPLIITEDVAFADLAKSLVTAATTNAKRTFQEVRKEIRNVSTIKSQFQKLNKSIKPIQNNITEFTNVMNYLVEDTKASFMKQLKENPLRNIPNAAKILRNALENSVKLGREKFVQLIKNSLVLLQEIKEVAPTAFTMLKNINDYIAAVSGKAFLNQNLVQDLVPIMTTSVPNIAEAAKKLSRKTEVIPAG